MTNASKAEFDPIHPIDRTIGERMTRLTYRDLVSVWQKANLRVIEDADGAITAAKSLLESTCKTILGELSIPVSPRADLPKLYGEVTKALGIAPGGQSDPMFRSIFSAAHQVMHSVSEIRNKFGDAHGATASSAKPTRAQAELAVHLAGAVSCYLISNFESHLSSTQRLTQRGQAILRFDKATVWRLLDHAANAPKSREWYGRKIGRCLLLVGDPEIYLISNGDPPLLATGRIAKRTWKPGQVRLLTATAEGCSVFDESEDLLRLHSAIDGGNDFAQPIPIKTIRPALESAQSHIVIVADTKVSDISTCESDLAA